MDLEQSRSDYERTKHSAQSYGILKVFEVQGILEKQIISDTGSSLGHQPWKQFKIM